MSHNNMEAFKAAKEITIAQISSCERVPAGKDSGEQTADFFETVFRRLAELDDASRKPKND